MDGRTDESSEQPFSQPVEQPSERSTEQQERKKEGNRKKYHQRAPGGRLWSERRAKDHMNGALHCRKKGVLKEPELLSLRGEI